jgi:hypothetical protein
MSETALNRVNSFTCLFEAANNFRNIIGIAMAQSKLSITVIFANSIHKTLYADKEPKIEAAADP